MLALATLVAISAAGPALAQSRPDSLTMTCAQAQALVRQQGAVVLGTGQFIYDRYVRDRSFCAPTQRAQTSFVQTKDNKYCLAGYLCREATPFDIWR
ncbi:hypothetical protein [Alsobacter sp. R-9]